MSKALLFGMAAIGGMAFFTLVSRYSLCHCMTGRRHVRRRRRQRGDDARRGWNVQ